MDLRWTTAAILNQSGETLVTLRWVPEGRVKPSFFGYQELGEAVIAPDVDFPVPQILLTAYAFALLVSVTTRDSG